MSRVWKRFLFKISKGVGIVAYILGSLGIGAVVSLWLGYDPQAGVLVGAGLFIFLPLITIVLRDTYRDSKEEVEQENRNILRALKGL
jgi:hypothetical protein